MTPAEKATAESQTQTTTSKVELTATPSKSTAGQQIVKSFKAPSSQFRTIGPSALVSESSINKSGQRVTTYYGTAEEQQAFRKEEIRKTKASLLRQARETDKEVLKAGLLEQQAISRQLRSGLVRPEKRAELKAKLAQPKQGALSGPALLTPTVTGGKPSRNLGYKVTGQTTTISKEAQRKRDQPIRYHAEKYKSGAIKGVGLGILGYAASQTTLVGGAGIATGATISAAPAAIVAGVAALAVGGYIGAREVGRKVQTFREGGFKAVHQREVARGKAALKFGSKYSGEIVEGVAAATFAVPTYAAAQAFYSPKIVPIGAEKGTITRKGPELTPTSKQVTRRSFQVGSDKYVVKAKTTAKESIRPSVLTTSKEKTTYTVFKVGEKGKLKAVKTISGAGEVQLKPSGEFVRFQKIGTDKTQMSVGTISKSGTKAKPRFIFHSTGGEIRGFDYSKKYSSFGFVEQTKSGPAPIPKDYRKITTPKISQKFTSAQSTRVIKKPTIGQKLNRAIAKGIIQQRGGNILIVDNTGLVAPQTEIQPVYGTLSKTGQGAGFLGPSFGSGAALSQALVPGIGSAAILTGSVSGAAILGRSIDKAAPSIVSPVAFFSPTKQVPGTLTGAYSRTKPISISEPGSFSEPLSQATPTPSVQPYTYPQQPTQPGIGFPSPGPIGFTPEPPGVPVGVPVPSLPPGGGVDSWTKSLLKKTKQPKGYTPSATALAFGIKGKPSKAGAKSGLGLRPILETKKTKKRRFKI